MNIGQVEEMESKASEWRRLEEEAHRLKTLIDLLRDHSKEWQLELHPRAHNLHGIVLHYEGWREQIVGSLVSEHARVIRLMESMQP